VPQLASAPAHDKRKGIVLLVVISLLALFASVGLSFVFYAEAEATASRYANQAGTMMSPDVDPELLLSYYLGQLIYDTDDIFSAMRGPSLPRGVSGMPLVPKLSGAVLDARGTPITIRSTSHGLYTGAIVYVSGVGGNTNANGGWQIAVVDQDNFALVGSTPTAGAVFTGGGTWTQANYGALNPSVTTPFSGTGALHYAVNHPLFAAAGPRHHYN